MVYTREEGQHLVACTDSYLALPHPNFRGKGRHWYLGLAKIIVGFGHSLRLHTLASLIRSPGMMSNPRKVLVCHRKLHFFSLQ